jgi:hypothetical protein
MSIIRITPIVAKEQQSVEFRYSSGKIFAVTAAGRLETLPGEELQEQMVE